MTKTPTIHSSSEEDTGLRAQLQTFMTETKQRFESIEAQQAQFTVQLHESQERSQLREEKTDQKLELILATLESLKKPDPTSPSPISHASAAQSVREVGQSSGIHGSQPLFSPSSLSVGRGFTFPPASPSHFSNPYPMPFLQSPGTNQNPPILPTPNSSPNRIQDQKDQPDNTQLVKAKINFPEFDGHNPRGWRRKCEKFFEIYCISESEKLKYITVHMKDKVEVWFDSYVTSRRGHISWPMFCSEICRRFGKMRPMNIVDEFNKLMQNNSVDRYQERFEELMGYMLIINPLLNESHFVSSFVSGLKTELKPLVMMASPVSLMDAFEAAKLYEESFNQTEFF